MGERGRPILLIEDSKDDAELAILALQKAGLSTRVDVVRDGEEALEYLFGGSEDDASRPLPFLVVLDIKLPKVDGFAVLRRIRNDASTRTLPIVILSSSDVPEDIALAYELGANSYVRKPVEFSDYSDTVRRIGEYWIRVSESAD